MARTTEQPEQIRISGKNLGAVALPSFCPRCFWIKLKMQHRLPYQSFPGIFSSIDAFTKRVVQGWFEAKKQAPQWLAQLGEIVECCDPPHYSKFNIVDERTNILLTGAADGIFRRADRSYVIADFKTARFTDAQDELLPMYQVQLNAYARIAESCGLAPVSALYLIYLEPQTDGGTNFVRCCRTAGMCMDFQAHVLPVDLNRQMIDPLLARTRDIYDGAVAPAGNTKCKDCRLLDVVLSLGLKRRKDRMSA